MRTQSSATAIRTPARAATLLWVALFVFSILLQYARVLASPTPALGASGLLAGTVAGFEIDGDLLSGNGASNPAATPDGPPPPGEDDFVDNLVDGDDWRDGASFNGVIQPPSPPASALVNDLTNSQSDDIFIGGAKEDDTRTWGYTTGKPTGKDDFDHVMAYAKFVGSNAFFFAGAERFHTTGGGDTTIDFELNRKPFRSFGGGPLVADREIGDLLISLEFANGGSEPEIRIFQVTAVQSFPTGEVATFTEKSNAQVSNAVHSATNFVDVTGFTGAGDTNPIATFDFAEMSIDLHALGIDPACPGFAAGNIRSRAGGDINSSQLKDRAPSFPIDLNTCGVINIVKTDAHGDPLGGATFSVTPNPIPGAPASPALSITDNGANDSDSRAGYIKIDPASPGTYTVCETAAPPGYILAAQCDTKTLANNGSITFSFTNALGSISWVKNGPDGASLLGGATFTITPNPRTGSGSLTVVDNGANDADSDAGEFKVVDAMIGGPYSVCETAAPSGYVMDPDCASVTLTQGSPDKSIAAGTFVNTLGSLAWEKRDGAGNLLGGATFHVTGPFGFDETVVDNAGLDADPDDGQFLLEDLKLGTYSVTETIAPAGYVRDTHTYQATLTQANPDREITTDFVNTLGSLAWEKRDGAGNLLGGATFTIDPDPSDGVGLMTVVDNGANDADSDAGQVLVTDVPIGSYSVCETAAPAGYVRDTVCRDVDVTQENPDAVIVDDFVNTLGSLAWEKRDGAGNLLGGATFHVTGPFGFDETVVDNAGLDADPDDGQFLLEDLKLGTYSVTETIAPAGYVRDTHTYQKTLTQGAPNGVITTDFVNTLGSLAWEKRDGAGNLLGGATFHVTGPFGFDETVTDNAGLDADPDAGQFLLEGLKLGTYSVTETAAPAGYVRDTHTYQKTLTQGAPNGVITTDFVNTLGSLTWYKVDGYSEPLGGATFHVTGPFGFDETVTDNAGLDADLDDGQFLLEDLLLGKYTVCETTPPDGYIGDPDCRQATLTQAAPDQTVTAPFINTLGSIEWIKDKGDGTEGPGTLLGGAVFEVSPNPYGSGDLTVDDCTPANLPCEAGGDQDPVGGQFLLVDVPIGTYTITELSAPEGYVPDESTCQVTVDAENPEGDTVCIFNDPPIPPEIDVVKTAGETAGTQVADGAVYVTEVFASNTVYKYVVTNTGDVRLVDVTLVDDNGTPANTADDFHVGACETSSLDPGDSTTCTITRTITRDTTNIVTATGFSVGEGTETSATDDAIVDVRGPAISIVKTAGDAADGGTYVTEAFTDNVTYHYSIENTGDLDLFDVVVTDDHGTPADTSDDLEICTIDSLPVGETETCEVTLTVTEDTTNVAVATGHTEQQPGKDVTDDDDAIVDIVAPGIRIVKTAGDAADGGTYVTEAFEDNVIYEYTVTNTGEVDLFDITVVDDNGTPANDSDDFTVGTIDELGVGDSKILAAVRTVTEDTSNVAVATGHTEQQPDEDVTDDDDAIVDIVAPGILIVKTAGDAADGETLVTLPGDVTFTYEVTNTGEVDLFDITVVDDNGTPADSSDDFLVGTIDELGVGESATLTATVEVTADRTNVAVATGHTEQQPDEDVSDDDDADVVVRNPGTGIAKSVDDEDHVVARGQTLEYTLTLTVSDGPVTEAVVTDELPDFQTFVSASDGGTESEGVITWELGTLETGTYTLTYTVTVDADAPTGAYENVAIFDTRETPPDQDEEIVRVPELTLVKTITAVDGEDPVIGEEGTISEGMVLVTDNDVVTYVLTWTLTNGPVTGAYLEDVLPEGLTYVDGSASRAGDFTGYDAETRTLRWDFGTLSESGSVTYEATVDSGLAEQAGEDGLVLRNVATIDSNETPPDSDDEDEFISGVLPITPPPTPVITPPPTSTETPGGPAGGSSLLVLLVLVAATLGLILGSPLPRRRTR